MRPQYSKVVSEYDFVTFQTRSVTQKKKKNKLQ